MYDLFSTVFSQVKVEDSFGPALEDESETIEHLLAEPKGEYVTVDGVLCFDKENAEKGLNMEDFSCGYDFGLNTYSGSATKCYLFMVPVPLLVKSTKLTPASFFPLLFEA